MSRRKKSSRRSFGFERLEDRRTMAGNVLVTSGGTVGWLDLYGDNAANAVEVKGTGVPGEVLITPLNGTTLSSEFPPRAPSTDPMLITGFTNNLSVNMNGGNDELYVKDLVVGGEGLIYGGAGADIIRIGAYVPYGQQGTGDVSFAKDLRVDEQFDTSTADADQIFLGRVNVGYALYVWGNLGNDSIQLYNVTVNSGEGGVDGFTTILHADDGNDVINVAYLTSRGYTDIQGDRNQAGSGNDVLSVITTVIYGNAMIDGYYGINTIALNANQFLGKLNVIGNNGTNTVSLTNSFCAKYVTLTCLAGNDSMRVENNTISEYLSVASGNGYDSIVIQSNQIVGAFVTAGNDSDTLTVRNNLFYGRADFYGQAGYDLLYASGNATAIPGAAYYFWEFEVIQP